MSLLKYLGEKTKFFSCEVFLSCVVNELFIVVSFFQETSPVLKTLWLRAWFITILLAFVKRKMSIFDFRKWNRYNSIITEAATEGVL